MRFTEGSSCIFSKWIAIPRAANVIMISQSRKAAAVSEADGAVDTYTNTGQSHGMHVTLTDMMPHGACGRSGSSMGKPLRDYGHNTAPSDASQMPVQPLVSTSCSAHTAVYLFGLVLLNNLLP